MRDYQKIIHAHVYLRENKVGQLEKNPIHGYSFTYDLTYLRAKNPVPVACVFPLQEEPFYSPELHPFFDNLILEGWLLSSAEKIFHIDRRNRFAVLMAVGRSPVGAVSVHPLDLDGEEIELNDLKDDIPNFATHLVEVEIPSDGGVCPICFKNSPKDRITHLQCERSIWGTSRKLQIELDSEQPLASFSRTIYGGSISGAQRKGLFSLDIKKGIISPNPLGSQYILKPDGDYPELPANEHLTMAIARKVGFNVPPSTLIHIPELGYVYVIRRFDQVRGGLKRRMEDMAQLINTPSDDKYRSSNEAIGKAIRTFSAAPALDLNDFFRRLVFCFLVGNADMHLKNWSLLEKESLNGEMDLSPCYDFLNTRLPIPREQTDIGLPILGKSKKLQGSYFSKFAVQYLKVEPRFVNKIFSELPFWHEVIEDFTAKSYLAASSRKRYLEIVRERFQTLMS